MGRSRRYPSEEVETMSDRPSEAPAQEGEGQGKIQVRDTGIATHYASFFSISAMRDAVVLMLGNQFGKPDMVQVEHKIAMSPANAKRMAISLGQVIRRLEEEQGEIDISARPQPPGTPQADQGK